MKKYLTIKKCRLCKSKRITKIKDLCESPLANNLARSKNESLNIRKFPLSIFFCKKCSHVQLGHIINKNLLFSNYLYMSGISEKLKTHFKKLSIEIKTKFLNKKNKNYKLLEIGSNDSTLLNHVREKNINTIGVEPASNLKKYFKNHDIFNSFFNYDTIKKIKKKYSTVDCVVANNVFAHIDKFDLVFDYLNEITHKNSIIIFEVSYLVDVINKNLIDTIYHEHLDYHKLISLQNFFKLKKFLLFNVKLVNTHGGSIRCYLIKEQKNIKINKNVQTLINYEQLNNFNSIKKYKNYFKLIEKNKIILKKKLSTYKTDQTIGYGAPAKLVTFLNLYFNDQKIINYIIDASPLKQNQYIPGFDIKILSLKKISDKKYKYVIIFAWNLYKEIIKTLEKYSNIKYFIVTIPKIKIIKNKNYAP